MAAYAHLKNEFTEDEKCHNLMSWLIWDPGLNYLTTVISGYGPRAFWSLMAHYIGACPIMLALIAVFLIYYRLNAHATINNFAWKFYLHQ